ncbi:hypothetical protein PM082_007768 [Marasmius tenuissimus]|nr:hypothetical protein PM082_007768 [Marasmius tenuissimus]
MPSIPPACSNTCLSNAPLDCATSVDCSCTDKYAASLGTCLDCIVKQDNSQMDKSQKYINSFTDACNGLGKSVKPVKITGNSDVSSNSGSSGGSGSNGGSIPGSSSGNGNGNGGGNGADSNAAMATRVLVVGLGVASVLLLC